MRYFKLVDGVGTDFYSVDFDDNVRRWYPEGGFWFETGGFQRLSELIEYVSEQGKFEDVQFNEVYYKEWL